ncbi:MAG: TetR/AcrR family transcriptional regulator [Gordonia sp. (in: high G+C Gram-positive bacteria)]|uniref:TetR/AcrR family transcriptional regulator n=1 Tax=Gordonia sp. (in: high G+C Gram-positive bacteria) TaxID=84139 RepID=UPI0039E417C4
MTGPRALRRQQIDQQILDLGRAQLAEVGAAALSVRAIARELGMVSSAVYRYVDSRDELLTRLVVAAYTDLADAVRRAVDADSGDAVARLAAAAHGFRRWALDHPTEFALLYGSPVPGYHAPPERTNEPGTRVIAILLGLIAEAAGDAAPTVPAALNDDLSRIADEFGHTLSPGTVLNALGLWTWLIGAVGQEVTGGLGTDTFTDPAAAFDAQLTRQLTLVVPA